MKQMWLKVLQEVNEGLITNEQASRKLGISISTFYRKKAMFIKDQQVFKEVIIVSNSTNEYKNNEE